MQPWLEYCESWLTRQYQTAIGVKMGGGAVRLRWLSADSLTNEVVREEAKALAIEDAEIGWILFLLPYEPVLLEGQVSQALGLRSRLLRESNYTGKIESGEGEDHVGSWRVGIVWLVDNDEWSKWQDHILELRRESGAAEEISFDAVKMSMDNVHAALDGHGMPRLLLHTRALLRQSQKEAEAWVSANIQVSSEMANFSKRFDSSRARTIARELEEKAKSYHPVETDQVESEVRQFHRFRVRNFRNLDHLEVVADRSEGNKVQAIVLSGPNGTGKSSLAEAISLAAFATSPRLEEFLVDKDLRRSTPEKYLVDYLTPLNRGNANPSFVWGEGEETPFTLNADGESKRKFDGIVLNQEDSIDFTKMAHEELAARVLKGYSDLADYLSSWLAQEEHRANEIKLAFTRKHGLSGAIKLSSTAYKGLAQELMLKELQRASPEFLDWLRFWGRLSGEDGSHASKLSSDWTNLDANLVDRLAGIVAKLQEKGASESQLAQEIQARLDEFDGLARLSADFRQRLENRLLPLRDQIDNAIIQIDTWGAWLASRLSVSSAAQADGQELKCELESLAKERVSVESDGKAFRSRLDLLDQSRQFLSSHWVNQHPHTCPVCNSDVEDRKGIEAVVVALQEETNVAVQALRTRYVEIQNRQKELDVKLKATSSSTCPLAVNDQARLTDWLTRFLPEGALLEDWLINPKQREQLKGDLKRMRVLPEAPKTYADARLEAGRLAKEFIGLSQEADKALEDPQAIGEVKKAFEQRLEVVLKDRLPTTLGRVWMEITLTLTSASWLLPQRPTLKIDQRGKLLSVQAGETGRHIRYVYNAAERHILGLAWFFTYYLARKRFQEGWILLDDPAQEMDQPSFRELVRFVESLLRLHQRIDRSFTVIVGLHQEGRALDMARATNGKLYMLGWEPRQQDLRKTSSVKQIVLLAPGFHPLTPDVMFAS